MINMSVDDHQDDPYYNPSPIAPPSNFRIFRWAILCLGAVFVLLIVAVVMIALQRPLGFWLVGIAFVLAVAGLFVYMQAIKAKQQLTFWGRKAADCEADLDGRARSADNRSCRCYCGTRDYGSGVLELLY